MLWITFGTSHEQKQRQEGNGWKNVRTDISSSGNCLVPLKQLSIYHTFFAISIISKAGDLAGKKVTIVLTVHQSKIHQISLLGHHHLPVLPCECIQTSQYFS